MKWFNKTTRRNVVRVVVKVEPEQIWKTVCLVLKNIIWICVALSDSDGKE